MSSLWSPRPTDPSINVIGSRFVRRRKLDSQGKVSAYKSRLVAKGYQERPGFDYTNVFAPQPRHASWRLTMAASAKLGMVLRQFDVKGAFLEVPVPEDRYIYLEIPPELQTEDNAGLVLRVLRWLYGLHEAPLEWYHHFCAKLIAIGWRRTNFDPCLFFRIIGAEERLELLCIWTDDGLAALDGDQSDADRLIEELRSVQLPIEDLGTPSTYLGMKIEVHHSLRTIHISQPALIDSLAKLLKVTNESRIRTIPLTINPASLFKSIDNPIIPTTDPRHKLYGVVVGKLNWLAIMTRFDLAFTVSVMSRFLREPTEKAWKACTRATRYLLGTRMHGITYSHAVDTGIAPDPFPYELAQTTGSVCYTDSSYGDDPICTRSTGAFMLTWRGCPINWQSKLQTVVAQSSMEAELIASCDGAKELAWFSKFFEDLIPGRSSQSTLAIDNSAAIQYAHGHTQHKNTKHIRIRFNYIREELARGEIYIQKVHTSINCADLLTKSLPDYHHSILSQRLGLLDWSNVKNILDFLS